ncbi:MAG: 2-iminoacetate synthase ThiH [Chthoniobacterales bacterium]|nr:2-iminoacetate synthase ThiH [Chthoniobacterales bacterium]
MHAPLVPPPDPAAVLAPLGLPLTPAVAAFARHLAPADNEQLEDMARRARALTRQHFGRTVRLFAPLYLSNECINSCTYCGFSRENAILRVTLEAEQVRAEARYLAAQGFRNILLVAGEHPKFVSNGYLGEILRALAPEMPALSIEVAPMETAEYVPLVRAGAEGLVVYQETYHRPTYAALHIAGPKKDYGWRLACPERGHAAGFRRIGIGVLLGLWDWREEAIALAAHLDDLLRTCWRAHFTVSLPRLRPAAGGFQPAHPVDDRDFVQLLCAFRLHFPRVGLVLSTREPAALRDAVAPLGITLMSAGSHTEPGGYTRVGHQNLHLTVRGRALACDTPQDTLATEQFSTSDQRPPKEVAARLRELGLDPVWKDWDRAILGA